MLSWKGDAWWMETLLCPLRLWGEEAAKLCRQHLKFHPPHRYWLMIPWPVPAGAIGYLQHEVKFCVTVAPTPLQRNKAGHDWAWKRVFSLQSGSQLACFITHAEHRLNILTHRVFLRAMKSSGRGLNALAPTSHTEAKCTHLQPSFRSLHRVLKQWCML